MLKTYFLLFCKYVFRIFIASLYLYSIIFFIFIVKDYLFFIIFVVFMIILYANKKFFRNQKPYSYFLKSIFWILVFFYQIHHFILGIYYVQSKSMYPLLKPNTVVLVDKFTMGFIIPVLKENLSSYLRCKKFVRNLQKGDIIVFWEKNVKRKYVKRIIATPNNTITFYKDGKIKVENQFLIDIRTNNFFQLTYKEIFFLFQHDNIKNDSFSIVVPEEKYYVLGDNHTVSIDSRKIGLINKNKIVGRVIYPVAL